VKKGSPAQKECNRKGKLINHAKNEVELNVFGGKDFMVTKVWVGKGHLRIWRSRSWRWRRSFWSRPPTGEVEDHFYLKKWRIRHPFEKLGIFFQKVPVDMDRILHAGKGVLFLGKESYSVLF